MRSILAAALLLALSACTGSSTGHAPAQSVNVGVEPRSTDVQVGGTARFAAVVTGTADTSVQWDVVEAAGGVIDGLGTYRAPATPGVFHVRATSRAVVDVRGEATVTVVETPVVTVTLSPRTQSIVAGGSATFAAAVANATNTAVDWSADCGTITPAGVYTAPATAGTCTVVARSQADPSKFDSAVVTVTAPPVVVVTVTPSPASADACTQLTFTATVTNATDRSVTWSVQEPDGGTITSQGVYTAPSTAGTYHVVATSNADGSRAAVADVTVSERVLGVSVRPQQVQVPAGGTAQFTATVTTSCGDVVATQTVNSAGQIVAN